MAKVKPNNQLGSENNRLFIASGLLFLIFGVALTYQFIHFGPGARLMPISYLLFLMVLIAFFLLFWSVHIPRGSRPQSFWKFLFYFVGFLIASFLAYAAYKL